MSVSGKTKGIDSRKNILISIDEYVSETVYNAYADSLGVKFPLVILEWSGHGIIWLAMTFALFLKPSMTAEIYSSLFHLFVGLITDLLWVAVLKPLVRRKRPVHDTGKQTLSVHVIDKYSFPSGHATRSMFVSGLSCLVWFKYGVGSRAGCLLMLGWTLLLGCSRVVMGRHYVGDVLCGFIVGILNLALVGTALWQTIENVEFVRTLLLDSITQVQFIVYEKLNKQ
mmetsp:Transcript_9328/g.16805  ORF Transcript_9328/g.16805 Transcript_9328/m.16805 type:complete len:226 (-) Transcript_9328:1198-1875(-)